MDWEWDGARLEKKGVRRGAEQGAGPMAAVGWVQVLVERGGADVCPLVRKAGGQ